MNLREGVNKFLERLGLKDINLDNIRDGLIVNTISSFINPFYAGLTSIAFKFFGKSKDEIKSILEESNLVIKLPDGKELYFKEFDKEEKEFLIEFLTKNLDKLDNENKFQEAFIEFIKENLTKTNINITGDNNKVITQGDININNNNGDIFNNVEIKGDFVKGDKQENKTIINQQNSSRPIGKFDGVYIDQSNAKAEGDIFGNVNGDVVKGDKIINSNKKSIDEKKSE
jgi:hypothetical protein